MSSNLPPANPGDEPEESVVPGMEPPAQPTWQPIPEQQPRNSGMFSSNTEKLILIIGACVVGALIIGGGATAVAVAATHGGMFSRGGPAMRHQGPPDGSGNFGHRFHDRQGPGQKSGPGGIDDFGGVGPGGLEGLTKIPGFDSIEHADVVVTGADGKPQTLRIVRGVVTASSPTSITVKAADGFTATYAINGTTQLNKFNQSQSGSIAAVGDNAIVIGTVAGETATASRVVVTPTVPTTPAQPTPVPSSS